MTKNQTTHTNREIAINNRRTLKQEELTIAKHLEKSGLDSIVSPIPMQQQVAGLSRKIMDKAPIIHSYLRFCRRKKSREIILRQKKSKSILFYFETENQKNALEPLWKDLESGSNSLILLNNSPKGTFAWMAAAFRPQNLKILIASYIIAQKLVKTSKIDLKTPETLSNLYGLVLWHIEFTKILGNGSDVVVMSNDHNFCNRALLLAALDSQKKTVYLQHGNVSKFFPKLNFHIALLDGKHAEKTYQNCLNAPSIGVHNIETKIKKIGNGRVSAIKSQKWEGGSNVVGVLTNTVVNPQKINFLTERLGPNFNILVRCHPNESTDRYQRRNFYNSHRVTFTEGCKSTLEDFCKKCDIVLAGNTSALIDCLLIGEKTVFIKDLDNLGDYFEYEQNELVPNLLIAELNPERLCKAMDTFKVNQAALRDYSATYGTNMWGGEYKLAAKIISNASR